MNLINAKKLHRKSGDMGHPSFVREREIWEMMVECVGRIESQRERAVESSHPSFVRE
jgi:hypothetical protein